MITAVYGGHHILMDTRSGSMSRCPKSVMAALSIQLRHCERCPRSAAAPGSFPPDAREARQIALPGLHRAPTNPIFQTRKHVPALARSGSPQDRRTRRSSQLYCQTPETWLPLALRAGLQAARPLGLSPRFPGKRPSDAIRIDGGIRACKDKFHI